jgi:hypothetical protein
MLRQEKDLHFNPLKVGVVGVDLQVVLSIKQKNALTVSNRTKGTAHPAYSLTTSF